jgi:transposase
MKKSNTKTARPDRAVVTIGIDLGDRFSHYAVLSEAGELIEEGRVRMTPEAVERKFGDWNYARVAIEVGTHSPWVRRTLSELGLEVIVANARDLRAITGSNNKNDREDARKLARLAQSSLDLLAPVRHRSETAQRDLLPIRSRALLVEERTRLVNGVRGLVKGFGYRLPLCATKNLPGKAAGRLPDWLEEPLRPLLVMIDMLSELIRQANVKIEAMVGERYAEAQVLLTVPRVGALTALTYVLTLDDPRRFPKSRDGGCYLGLRPRRSQSGGSDPQLGITKAGDVYLRKLLVQCAHQILGRWGPESALRSWGLRLCERGGKNAKKKAVVAVARKLAVLLHKLWVTQQRWEAFPAAAA